MRCAWLQRVRSLCPLCLRLQRVMSSVLLATAATKMVAKFREPILDFVDRQ